MPNAPTLLDESGNASIATAPTMSHHAFRRDSSRASRLRCPRSPTAVPRSSAPSRMNEPSTQAPCTVTITPRTPASFRCSRRTTSRCAEPSKGSRPITTRSIRSSSEAIARSPISPTTADEARAVASELSALLDPHLATEEAQIVPQLRAMKGFPPPNNAEEEAMYADGFALVVAYRPGGAREGRRDAPGRTAGAPAGRARRVRGAVEPGVWGPVPAGSATTPIPTR